MAAIKEWRERQLTGAAYQGPEVIPRDEGEQMPWNLAKGFDVVTEQLGGGLLLGGALLVRTELFVTLREGGAERLCVHLGYASHFACARMRP